MIAISCRFTPLSTFSSPAAYHFAAMASPFSPPAAAIFSFVHFSFIRQLIFSLFSYFIRCRKSAAMPCQLVAASHYYLLRRRYADTPCHYVFILIYAFLSHFRQRLFSRCRQRLSFAASWPPPLAAAIAAADIFAAAGWFIYAAARWLICAGDTPLPPPHFSSPMPLRPLSPAAADDCLRWRCHY
jgi:purine-cytosine permease-like protein